MAVDIQLVQAILYQIVAVTVIVAFAVGFIRFAKVALDLIAPPPVVIAGAVDVVLDLRVSDRRAEEISCFHRKLDSFAHGNEFLLSGDDDFVFWLLIFLDFEIA